MDENRFVISPEERVLRVLDRLTSDVYPYEVRCRLARFAIERHGGDDTLTHRRRVTRALRWLREQGHL